MIAPPLVSLGSNLTIALLVAIGFGALLILAYNHGRRR